MLETLSNVKITGVVRGNSTQKAHIEGRPSHTLIAKINGESLYHLRDEDVRLCEGKVLYIPEGESYRFEKISEGDSVYCLVNFHADADGASPHLFSPPEPWHIESVFSQMEAAQRRGEPYELLSLFYHLLSLLLHPDNAAPRSAEKSIRLAPALSYLDTHLYDESLSVGVLSALCDISEVTLRGLFAALYGEAPKRYIIRCRMQKARAIIESGEFQSIGEVAYAVGYRDPLYFSRHFKQYYGVSPSKIV